MPTYLDANGNPITSTPQKTYLDANGEPVKAAVPTDDRGTIQRIQDSFDKNTASAPGDGHIANVLKGAVQAAGSPVIHPLDTATSLVKTLANVANPLRIGPPQFAKDMYHSVADAPDKVAAAERLAGNLVGGMATSELGSTAAAPIIRAAGPIAGRVALLGKTPEGAYESALKPSVTLSPADRAGIVKTGLEQGIPIAKSGLEKLGEKIETLNQAIKDEIGKDPNRPIDPNKVATRADAARARFATQVNAQPDLNAIEASRNQFLQEQGQPQLAPGVSGPPSPAPQMAASDAQAMKQGTYRVLNGKFGEQGSASVEAQKSLARGLKEEISTAFPEIGKLNSDESRLLDLQPVLERAVNRISNREPIGIGGPILGTAAKAMTGSTGAAAAIGVMKEILSVPALKSRIAIAVSRGAKIPYAQALARVGAYSTSLGATADAPQGSTSDGNPNQPTSSQP